MTWGRSELRSFKRRSWEDYMDCDGDLAAAAAVFLNIFLSDSFWFVCRMRNRLAFPPFNATGWGSNPFPRPAVQEKTKIWVFYFPVSYTGFLYGVQWMEEEFLYSFLLYHFAPCVFCLVLIVSNPLHLLSLVRLSLYFSQLSAGIGTRQPKKKNRKERRWSYHWAPRSTRLRRTRRDRSRPA